MITVFSGGVGASRFLQGLVHAVDPATVTVISNTGDDVEMFGLHVSPDTDIVIYALAGAVNPETGWGLAGDTFAVVDQLQRFGYPRWFNLGDRDLAMAMHRTRLLREGVPMHEVVAGLARDWGLACRILPMANEPVRTKVFGPAGEIDFQEYMVRLRTEVEVRSIAFEGADTAQPAPGVIEAIRDSECVILAPSNPFVSIGPVLAVPGVRAALERTRAVRAAISPIIAGQVVKGPAAKMLQSLGHEVSAVGVARVYRGLIDLMVIDEQDRALVPQIEALGIRCYVTDTMMTSLERKTDLAGGMLVDHREHGGVGSRQRECGVPREPARIRINLPARVAAGNGGGVRQGVAVRVCGDHVELDDVTLRNRQVLERLDGRRGVCDLHGVARHPAAALDAVGRPHLGRPELA